MRAHCRSIGRSTRDEGHVELGRYVGDWSRLALAGIAVHGTGEVGRRSSGCRGHRVGAEIQAVSLGVDAKVGREMVY